jgi:phosphoadenosine phosphosulfate reductase
VIWIDTGYLFPETYQFAEELTKRLELNLKVYQSPISPARMEALWGKLWSGGVEGLDRYHRIRKVEPYQRALRELSVKACFAGLRAEQTDYRRQLQRISRVDNRYALLPILHWRSDRVSQYLARHDLPAHPLRENGYASVGDWHSSRPLSTRDRHERKTRFRGLKQECGIHLPLTPEAEESLDSSGL